MKDDSIREDLLRIFLRALVFQVTTVIIGSFMITAIFGNGAYYEALAEGTSKLNVLGGFFMLLPVCLVFTAVATLLPVFPLAIFSSLMHEYVKPKWITVSVISLTALLILPLVIGNLTEIFPDSFYIKRMTPFLACLGGTLISGRV